ncbi:MAG TPA: zf-HC2 domain-containing protein [Actinomycetota bacterium]|nr:zf-HC2 domain-containing protein [Actinomycetota bacterium]
MTAPAELTCKELVELVTEFLEGYLPEPDRERFEAHLAICDGCTAYVEQMRTTIRVTGTLTEEQVPQEATDRLLSAFRSWKDR